MIRFPILSANLYARHLNKLNSISPKLIVLFSSNPQNQQHTQNSSKRSNKIQCYVPIRPLKKQLTTLFGDKQYLNKDQLPPSFNLLHYVFPTFALILHNCLMGWTIINSLGIVGTFYLSWTLSLNPFQRSSRRLLKLQASKDLSQFYLTVVGSYRITYIKQNYQQATKPEYQNFAMFSPPDLSEFQPTQQQKNTLSEKKLTQLKQNHANKCIGEIMRFNLNCRKVARIKVKRQELQFGLSNNILGNINQFQELSNTAQPTTKQLLSNICRYLIIKTSFFIDKSRKQVAYYAADLQANGEMKYEDYLLALGRKYQIKSEQLK